MNTNDVNSFSALNDSRAETVGVVRPLVSIIVTSYNYARYITQCLDSVRAQTYDHWECIIVDDVSTDETPALMAEYLACHGERHDFRFIRRKHNGGQMESFRDGLALAAGTFVMMLDADDVLLPDFMETHLAVHLGRKSVAFTSSNQYQINERGELIGGDHPDHLSKGKYLYVPQQTFQNTWWIWATSSSMLFRRAALNLIMPDPGITFRICADYYIAHFCQQVGNSILIPSVHGCYRRHQENNYSANPLVGAINSLGDFSNHPPHKDYRLAMAGHVLKHFDHFFPIFGHWGVLVMLFRLATRKEMADFLQQYGPLFDPIRENILKRYDKFHASRRYYDNGPWEKRLMVIGPPQRDFVPQPPTPGEILSRAVKKRLFRWLFGEDLA